MAYFKKINLLVLVFFIFGSGPVWAGGIGKLAFVQGKVFVNDKEAQDGQDLDVGDVVKTESGKCAILLGKESVFHLDNESQIKISKYMIEKNTKEEKASVSLDFGKTKALVKSKSILRKNFDINARGAVMGVRGTSVFVHNPRDISLPMSFATLSGRADLMIPARAVGPGGRPEMKKLVLRVNQLAKTGEGLGESGLEVENVAPEVIQEMANEVAPPQELPRTQAEVQEFAGTEGGSFIPKYKPVITELEEEMPPENKPPVPKRDVTTITPPKRVQVPVAVRFQPVVIQ